MFNTTTAGLVTSTTASDVVAVIAAAAAAASMTATTADPDEMLSSTMTDILSLDVQKAMIEIDTDLKVSPVTLSSDWSRVARLLLLASLAVVGSVGNVFMISAVMVEDHLRKLGIVYLIYIILSFEFILIFILF